MSYTKVWPTIEEAFTDAASKSLVIDNYFIVACDPEKGYYVIETSGAQYNYIGIMAVFCKGERI